MSYLYIILSCLFVTLLLDIILCLFRLKIIGIKNCYKLITKDVGYISKKGTSFAGDTFKRVLIVGDSTAVGSGVDPIDTIGGRLARTFGLDVTNVSINGTKTADVIRQIKQVVDKKFYLTIIQVGNNDVWKFTNLSTIHKDLENVLHEASQISDHIVLFRGGNFSSIPFFPYILRFIFGVRSKKIGRIFREVAKSESMIYVEKFMSVRNDIFLKDPRNFYFWDLLHLNKNGYEIWFNYLIEELEKNNIYLNNPRNNS